MRLQGLESSSISTQSISGYRKENEIKVKAKEGQKYMEVNVPHEEFAFGIRNRYFINDLDHRLPSGMLFAIHMLLTRNSSRGKEKQCWPCWMAIREKTLPKFTPQRKVMKGQLIGRKLWRRTISNYQNSRMSNRKSSPSFRSREVKSNDRDHKSLSLPMNAKL